MSSTATPEQAREHARAQAGTAAEAMPIIPAATYDSPPSGVDASALTWVEIVPGNGYTHKVLARGTRLRLTDVDGAACAHVLLYNADQPWERLNVADTVKVQWNAYLGDRVLLLSDQARVLAGIVADESGRHDALCGIAPRDLPLLHLAAAKHGLTPRDIPPSLSFFQGVRVQPDGSFEIQGSAGPGKSLDLRIELPVIALIVNAPHPLSSDPATPLRIVAWQDRPTTPDNPEWTYSPEGQRAFENTADYLTARGLA
ncbi:DUF1989 domain-containing protein [Pseudonocardiaceae bacterium YIM PH 21723]|nr:DUF1989 domain-containing protein [Pseudonocardiaceae bacterium YIM PH 21723]